MTTTIETAARNQEVITDPTDELVDELTPQRLGGELPVMSLTERNRSDAAFETGALDAFGSGSPPPA